MKNKKSKQELTRLILTALILGGGCLYGPIAEAATVTVTGTPDNLPSGSGLTKSSDIVYANSNSTQWTLNYGAGDAWNNYSIFGGYIITGNSNPSDYTITLANSGNSTIEKLMGAYGNSSATTTNVYGSNVYMTDGKAKIIIGGYSYKGRAGKADDSDTGNTVTINGGTVEGLIDSDISNEKTGVIGGCAGLAADSSSTAGAFYNQVTISPTAATSITGNVYGGYSGHNNANNNKVTIENPNSKSLTFTNSTIYGGYSLSGNANNNSVTLGGTTTEPIIIGGNVVGGRGSGDVSGNSVTLKGTATIGGNLYGGMQGTAVASDGNVLYLAGNAQGNTVTNQNKVVNGFEKFVIKNDFTFKKDKTILSAYQFLNAYGIEIDLTSATKLTSDKLSAGTMTLFSTTGSSGMGTLFVTGKTGQLTTSGFEISTFTNDVHSLTNKVTLTHSGKHKIYVDNNTTTKNVYYKIENILSNVNLSSWNGTTSAVPTGWTKDGTVSVSGTFTAPSSVTAGTSKDILTAGSALFSDSGIAAAIKYNPNVAFSKNLATGITISGNQGTGVKASTDGKKLTYYNAAEDKDNMTGVTLGAMTWGQDPATATGYTFKSGASGATITATNLSFGTTNALIKNGDTKTLLNATGLNGSNTVTNGTGKTITIDDYTDANGIKYDATATGDVVSTTNKVNFNVTGVTLGSINLSGWNGNSTSSLDDYDWTKAAGGINVSGVFTKPSLAPGASKTILTTGTADFFSNATISEDIRYKTGDSFSDTVNGVTLAGNKAGGVMATNNYQDLTFYGEKNDVNSVSLGSMTWGTPREATAAYDFSGVTSIDASSLGFTGTATLNSLNDSTNLLTGATGLATDNILNGSNKNFAIEYTDNSTKVKYIGTATTGDVSRDGTTLKYTVTGGDLNTIDLGKWNGTAVTGDLPAGWTPPSGGVEVDTGDFKTPTGNTNVDIFTTDTEGFFNEGNIDGDKKYKDHEEMPDDPENGVTISGNKTGGIAPSNDGSTPTTSGKRLTYFAEYTTGTGISLGEVAWNKGDTARTLEGNYDFSGLGNNDVDATNLKFTFANDTDGKSVNKIAKNDTMTILSGATGLNTGLTVKSSPVSQSISYSGLANKVGLTGTLTGNVTTTAGAVNYKVSSKTLDSVNLSNWNGNNTDLDASWEKNTNGINVTGSGFTAPTAIGDTPILTAGSNGFFTNAIIADNIKFQPSGAYSETDSNITLSGSRGSGVKANDDGDKLVYSIGAAFINNVKLGTVDYTKGGTWITKSDTSKYNFSNLSSLDTTGFVMSMTEDQRKSAAKNDTMTLIAGNTTLENIAAKDAGIINYSYDAKAGSITVGGTVTGSVSASGNNVLYTVKDNTATTLDLATVKWGETYARSGSDLNFSDAVVNSSNIFFSGVNTLAKDQVMTLISNYGGDINKTRAGIFTVDDGNGNILKGKGVAYYDKINDKLMYKVTLGAGEIQPAVSATNNKAILIVPGGDEHPGTVTGGEAKGDGESTGNEQKVKGKIVTNTDGTGGDVNGGTSEEGDSKRNKADVEDSTIEGDVNGGKSDNGNSTDNEADVDNSTVHGDVNGGDTNGDGGTKGNRANVKHGSVVKGNVNGGHSGGNGDSSGNEANVDDSTVDHDVNGGYSEGSGNANENKTTVSGSTIGGGVNGGHSGTGSTNKNETTVSDSTVTGDVTGGRNDGDGTANENKTTVSGSNVGGDVIGGQSKNGNTNQNEVSVSGGSVGGEVIGGKTENGSSSNNNVTISGNTDVNGKVYGGYSENGSASGNTVTIKNASVRDYVYGGKSKSQSSNNSVLFEPGKALGIIGGGCEVSTNNTAELREGAVDEHVIGGFATATATSNTATVTGGTVTGSVIGGYGGTTAADNNTVNLGGGTVTGNTITSATLGVTIDGGVYGGYSVSGTTQNNTVNIFGSADVSNTGLFGGNLQYNGNVLNIGYNNTPWTGGGQSVKDIKNFESMNFSIVPWSTTQSGVTISNGGSSDLSMTTVSAKEVAFTGVKSLAVNDTMTLLDQSAVDGAKQATNVVENSNYTLGTVQEGTGTLTKDANGNVLYQVETASVSKQTHNTVMAAEAALVSINAGNDFINSATDGLARDENMGKDGMATYAKIGGQSLEHETGSHVNVNTWNAILAVGHKNVKKKSTFEYGAFVEHGRGNFTTHNDGLRGDGSVDYTGGGLLAKWKTNNGTYVEGSFRAGTVNEKANNLLRDAVQGYGYDERTSYAGFHIGVGKETVLKNGNLVDVYGKYFYNRKNGMNFNAGFDEYNIDAVTSQILRVGARYTVKSGSRWNYYGDLSYEHEFDGKATGRANGMAIRGADISGGSVRLELGASLVPNDESPWNVDFNLTAYAGNKSGFTGGVSVKYAF